MPLALLLLVLAADLVPPQPDTPFSQPQIASDGAVTGLVFGSKNTIFYAGIGSEPVVVAQTPNLSLGNHRGPRLAFTRDAIVVTAGIGPANEQYGFNTLRSWRSLDRGKTWRPAADVSTPGTGGMGFQGIASDGGTRVWAAWIGPSNGHPTLFVSRSYDSGATWVKQRVLSETVCECCHPTVALAADGSVHVLFRNNLNGNRDFYLASSKDGSDFRIAKLGTGNWAINACPMDGGGMAERKGAIVTIWRRENQLYLARPDGKPEEPFAAGRNASIALRDSGMYAVWSAPEGIMVATPGKPARPLSKTGAFPVIAPSGPLIVAWEDGGKIRTEHLD